MSDRGHSPQERSEEVEASLENPALRNGPAEWVNDERVSGEGGRFNPGEREEE